MSLQPGRWKAKSVKEATRKKRPWNQSKTGNFKTPEMQDTGGEKPETSTCYNWLHYGVLFNPWKVKKIFCVHFPGFQSLLGKRVWSVALKERNSLLSAAQVSATLQMNYFLLHKKHPRPPLVLKAFFKQDCKIISLLTVPGNIN